MALQVHQSCLPFLASSTGSKSSWPARTSTVVHAGDSHRFSSTVKIRSKKGLVSSPVRVRSSLDVGPTVVVGKVSEVDKDTFWPIVNAAGDKTVVLDMYTQW